MRVKVELIKRTVLATVAVLAGLVVLGSSGGTAAAAADNRIKTYVALGDSVAAGLGLVPGFGAPAEDQLCGRSSQAYAATVAAGLRTLSNKIPRVTNAACSGAVVNHLVVPQTVGSASVQPQLDTAFAAGVPDLMTLTAGANDVQWANFIGLCLASTCGTQANTDTADALLAGLRTNLRSNFTAVQERSHGQPPQVIVTGYYHPLSERCINGNLTAAEVAWLNLQTDKLNMVIQETSREFNFTKFAPVDFTGHDICSADPWMQRPGVPGEPAPFHPTAKGQEVIGKAVLRSLTTVSE